MSETLYSVETGTGARVVAKMPKRVDLPEQEIAGLYRGGLSWPQLGERYGVSPVTLARRMAKIGVTSRSDKEAAAIAREAGRVPKTRYWLGKKRSAESRSKQAASISGENNHRWKGGKDDPRRYRKVIEKVECERCLVRSRLAIHHKNGDHYDDRRENLAVLCASCHASVHKQAYWDAVKAGKEPPRSNAPIRWGP